jgi:hypothetical protein
MKAPEHLRRGNLLWESSRMMLPEHREQFLRDQTARKKHVTPSLDEQLLQEFSGRLRQALMLGESVRLTCLVDAAYVHYDGVPVRADDMQRTVLLRTADGGNQRVALDHIVAMD